MSMWNLGVYGGLQIEPEDLRKIIQGKCHIGRCPDCNGDGTIYLHYKSDDDFNPQQVSRQFYDDWESNEDDEGDGPSLAVEDCETCYGVGYVGAVES